MPGEPEGIGLFGTPGAPPSELKKLESLFRETEMIAVRSKWWHSGFHIFCDNRISPNDEMDIENPAHTIIRACGADGWVTKYEEGMAKQGVLFEGEMR